MSGDVQPRKRKDKRKKKGSLDVKRSEEYSEERTIFRRQSSTASDEEDFIHHHGSISGSDEVIHVYKENKLGGNICTKIVFFGLLGVLGLMVSLIIIEYHGSNDVNTQSASDSPWATMLEGWLDDKTGHDDHEDHDSEVEPSSHEEDHDHDDEHDNADSKGFGDHEEEESEDDVEDVSFVQQTFADLKAAYSQVTPEESDVEDLTTEEPLSKVTDYEATESEPEPSLSEEEEEEDLPEDDPLGQWKSESGLDLLAEEVEEVQTEGSETEEESDNESSLPIVPSGGPKSNEIMDSFEDEERVNEEVLESTRKREETDSQVEDFKDEDISKEAAWQIVEELDDAERHLEEGDFAE